MTSVVLVDTGGTVVEYVTADEDPQQVGLDTDKSKSNTATAVCHRIFSHICLILLLQTFFFLTVSIP